MTRVTFFAIMLAVSAAAVAEAQADQRRPVRDVVVAEVNGDLAGFLDRMKRIDGVNRRLALGAELRVFQATFAGRQTGEIYVYWELPSFMSFAEAETKLHADPEYRAILAELEKAGQRFTSELLTVEITKR